MLGHEACSTSLDSGMVMSSVGVAQSHDWLTKEMSKLLWLGEPVLSTGPPGWDAEQRRVIELVL